MCVCEDKNSRKVKGRNTEQQRRGCCTNKKTSCNVTVMINECGETVKHVTLELTTGNTG